MKCQTKEITATTSNAWINPPATWNTTQPKIQQTRNTKKSARNMRPPVTAQTAVFGIDTTIGQANSGLHLPHGLVNSTLSLQIVVACQRANSLLDLALRLSRWRIAVTRI